MTILGVNGWFERGHDASACLVQDGNILFAIEEEKLIRSKHAYDQLPTQSIACCLDSQKLSVNDLDYIAVGWNIPKLYQIHNKFCPFKDDKEFNDILLPKEEFGRTKVIPVIFFDHHLAHASSSFRVSGFNDAMILVLDGQGEDLSGSIWKGENKNIIPIVSFPIEFSLGYFYEAVSSYIGFDESHAGKTMGLAGYGKLTEDLGYFSLIENGYCLEKEFGVNLNHGKLDEQEKIYPYWLQRLIGDFGQPNQPIYKFSSLHGKIKMETQIGPREEMIACLAQNELEKIILHLIKKNLPQINSKNLCLAGGVALNCTVNGKILKSGLVENLFIQPAAYDAGCALGAALELATQLGQIKQRQDSFSAFLGPKYTDLDIHKVLHYLGILHTKPKDLTGEIVNYLLNGKVVCWFQDRVEIGPRALGSRSVLADPRTLKMQKKVNLIKGRELWRPLSPSLNEDSIKLFFGEYVSSPFMLLTLPVLDNMKGQIPSVIHIDGTMRPQIVSPNQEKYYKLIQAFGKASSIPLIINTSFNGPGEPIVATPYNAIQTFYDRPFEILVLGNFIIKKGG